MGKINKNKTDRNQKPRALFPVAIFLYLFMLKKRILVAPLNWGLGHASRCIPIIRELEKEGFEPVIASDGQALELLKKEFPLMEFHELPSYNISYSRKKVFFSFHLLLKIPHIIKTISEENKAVQKLVEIENISGIISDNRWGVRSGKVPSVFITHQVNVLSGLTTFFSSRIQQNYIRKFKECWVPDISGTQNLSGKMGHVKKELNLKYIGILSRFKKEDLPQTFDIAVILSGPEPQRSLLEEILKKELKDFPGSILFVRGIVEAEKVEEIRGNMTIYNFLTSEELQIHLNQSKLIICRSGYSSLMDLAVLEKQAFLIPTPGQPEQAYLGKKLRSEKIAAGCAQQEFKIEKLKEVENYKGLGEFPLRSRLGEAFALFKGE